MVVNQIGSNENAQLKTVQKLGNGQIENPKGKLGKDEFLKLLLVELEHQDPTSPVETDKILSQTSQLASLEASTNTNKELQNLSGALHSSMRFSTVGAMGKVASIGNDEILLNEKGAVSFEIYFPNAAKKGEIEITDTLGNIVRTIGIANVQKGINKFNWDGLSNKGDRIEEGSYHVKANFITPKGVEGESFVGIYPISSIKFDEGKSMLKMGSQYVPFKMLKEIYDTKNL